MSYWSEANTGRGFHTAASSSSPVIFAVWDAGGSDTLDFSGYAQTQHIDLNDGALSNVGGLTGKVAIAVGVAIENALGGSGADTMLGNERANTLRGDPGGDVLDGNAGAGALWGGVGADRFVFDQLTDSRAGAVDRNHDSQSGNDKVALSAIDARTNVSGNQAFTLVSSFSGSSGQAVASYSSGTGLTTLNLDVNGDRVADFTR